MVEPRVVKVIDVQSGVDMRVTHSYLDERECRALRPGQCIIRVNARRSMMRVFMGGDGYLEPGMMTVWAREGQKWSREKIKNWMRNGANVELDDIYKGAERVEKTPLKIVPGKTQPARRRAAGVRRAQRAIA